MLFPIPTLSIGAAYAGEGLISRRILRAHNSHHPVDWCPADASARINVFDPFSQDLVRDVALACLRGGSGSEVALRALVTGVPHLMPGMCERAGGGWGFWLAGRSLIIEALKQRNFGCIRVLAQAVLGGGTNQRARVCCTDAMRLITSTGTYALVESGVRIGDMLGKVWIPATNEEERLNCMMEMVVETADQRLRKRGQGSTHGQKGNPVNSLAIHAGRDSMLKGR
jgi:hypothetical protein